MATPNPYDLEQDAFVRQMGGGASTMPIGGRSPLDAAGVNPVPETSGLSTSVAGDTKQQDLSGGNSQASRNALGGYAGVGQMNGFRQDDYGGDQKAANSMKNTYGRIASRYEQKPSSLGAIMADPDFQRYFPNAKQAGFDKIDFGGTLSDFESGTPVGLVDVFQGADEANDTSAGGQWLDQNFMGGQGGGGSVMDGGGSSDLMAALTAGGGLTGNDTLERIQKELQALINGQPSDVSQDAFMGAMR